MPVASPVPARADPGFAAAMSEPRAGPTLWDFSLAFYALPEVAPALIALQDRAGLDVNLILYGLWHGLCGRGRLTAEDLAAAERAVGPVRQGLVAPLRAVRRRLKADPDAQVQRLREQVKQLELAAERLAQDRLAALARMPASDTDATARRAAARANLALCLGRQAGSAEAAALGAALDGYRHGG